MNLLSRKIHISEEFLAGILKNENYHPDYSSYFSARHITTPLNWEDLVITEPREEELKNISGWMHHEQEIRSGWNLDKYIRPGYRCLFYGPPGTGRTLAASLLGKQRGVDVFRIDLSVVTSGNPVGAVKTIAEIFRVSQEKNRILFFSEADRLFGTNNSLAPGYSLQISQEILFFLLQRIEDFPGMIIMSSYLQKDSLKAFFRNFQSVVPFPMPDQNLRFRLWK